MTIIYAAINLDPLATLVYIVGLTVIIAGGLALFFGITVAAWAYTVERAGHTKAFLIWRWARMKNAEKESS